MNNDEDTPTRELVEAARRITGNHRRPSMPPWKTILLGASVAMAASSAGWIGKTAWAGLSDEITKGKADVTSLDSLRATNEGQHQFINTKLDRLEKNQKENSKITRKIARKLKIELEGEEQ